MMTILEHLFDKYGNELISSILAAIPNEKNFSILKQYLSISEFQIESFSHYKSALIAKLRDYIDDKYLLYELTNIISEIDFSFKKYNTCITYGSFDLFHHGHLQLLKRIKSMCSNLIVGVSTDEFHELKGKKCIIQYDQRAEIVSAVKYVDKVIPETMWEQKRFDIDRFHVDCLVMGDDWKCKFDFLRDACDVVYLSRTEGISTTEIKDRLR